MYGFSAWRGISRSWHSPAVAPSSTGWARSTRSRTNWLGATARARSIGAPPWAGALDPFGSAFDAVVSDPRELDARLEAILYVSVAEWRRVEARRRGMRDVAPAELGSALAVPTPQS